MSNYAALGLLQGLGKGVANVGRDMSKNAIVAAQDNRAANREKLRREFAATENNRIYERNQGDQYSDNVDAITGARIRNKDTEGYEGETTSAAAWNQANKPASAFKEKVDYFDGKLKNKEITQDQYDVALGLSKSTGMTSSDQVKFKMQATEQASLEILGKDPMKAATPEQIKAIDTRATQIFNKAVGGGQSGGGEELITIHPTEITNLANAMVKADYDPAKDQAAEAKKLQAAHYSPESITDILSQAEKLAAEKAKKTTAASAESTAKADEEAFNRRVASAQANGTKLSPEDEERLNSIQKKKNAPRVNHLDNPDARQKRREEAKEKYEAGLLG